MYGLCLSRLRNPEDAEDATQETFSRALGAGATVGEAWLITVARNVCTDHLRRRARNMTVVSCDEDEHETALAGPDVEVVGQAAVQHLLGQLTGAERSVVAATVLNDRSHADAARSLGIASGTSRVLLSRAARKMRTYLSDHPEMLGAQLALPAVRFLRRLREMASHTLGDGLSQTAALGVPSMMAAVVAMAPGGLPMTGAALPETGGAVVASSGVGTLTRVPGTLAQPGAVATAPGSPDTDPAATNAVVLPSAAPAPLPQPSSGFGAGPGTVSVTATSTASVPASGPARLTLTVTAVVRLPRVLPAPQR